MARLKICKTLRWGACAALTLGTLLGTTAMADPVFTVTYLAAGVQTPQGITSNYENFNSIAVTNGTATTNFNGSSITGTYTGQFEIMPANAYGGAGGTGSYLAQQYKQSTTLTLSQSVNYFGLWFSALDTGNLLQFYDNGTLVYSFTPTDFIADVGVCGGGNLYCGNPNNGQDPDQQFAYINFYDIGSTFNQVVFSEGPGGNFESDNNAVANVNSGTTGTVISPTPEPSGIVLLGTGIAGLAMVLRRRTPLNASI